MAFTAFTHSFPFIQVILSLHHMYSSCIVSIKIHYFHAPSLILILHLPTRPISFDGPAWLPQVSLSVHLPRRVVRTPNASFELRCYTSLKNTHPA